MDAELGRLRVLLGGDASDFTRMLSESEQSTKGFKSSTETTSKSVGDLGDVIDNVSKAASVLTGNFRVLAGAGVLGGVVAAAALAANKVHGLAADMVTLERNARSAGLSLRDFQIQ